METQKIEAITRYRIVRSMLPAPRDTRCGQALEKEPRDDSDPDVRRLWSGISMFDSVGRARGLAQRSPWNGTAFIATVTFPRSRFTVERTRSRGHYTVWGDPHAMLEYVT